MTIRRIVPNLAADDPTGLAAFYAQALGLAVVMDHGFITTLAAGGAQMSLARDGGSGQPVPALSIEVDDLDAALSATRAAGGVIEYGPVAEPWGVRRFFFRDPAGHLVNILSHA